MCRSEVCEGETIAVENETASNLPAQRFENLTQIKNCVIRTKFISMHVHQARGTLCITPADAWTILFSSPAAPLRST